MCRALSCIVLHLAYAIPNKTISEPLFGIVLHLPNAVPSRTMQTRLFYSVCHCSTFAKCSTEQNNREQCKPDCFTRYGSVLYLPNAEQ